MALLKIYQPVKTAMQSGRAKTRGWTAMFVTSPEQQRDPLMGWTSSDNTQKQIVLEFDTLEQATSYAIKHQHTFHIVYPQLTRFRPRAYSDNFKAL